MTRHTHDTIGATLRDLDPAATTGLTQAERARADAIFARVVSTPDEAPGSAQPVRLAPRRTRWLVTAGVGAAGAAVTGVLLAGGTAYGSWTPTPAPLTGPDADGAASTCRAALEVPDRGERIAVAEQRGEWTYVLLAGPRAEASCLMPRDLVGEDTPDPGSFFGSYDTDPPDVPSVVSDGLDETSSMVGGTDEGWFTWVEGWVGSDVTGVTVHTSSGLDIEASVVGKRFAAWWPSHEQSSDHPSETWSYTVHLADGSSARTR